MLHQLVSSKLSHFAQTCQIARMASTWMEILLERISTVVNSFKQTHFQKWFVFFVTFSHCETTFSAL
jgi:hypothetical protein